MGADPADERERIRCAAAALSPLERDVLTLSARLKLPNGDIAVRLGISDRRVERLLARAVSRIDMALDRSKPPWWRFW